VIIKGEEKLSGVHPDLVRIIKRAGKSGEFVVVEGVRTLERQRTLVASGKSRTLNSRHIPAKNGYGHAVDIYPVYQNKVILTWDGGHFKKLSKIVKDAAIAEGIPIEWGGDWKSFLDGPHWQLPWSSYDGSGADDEVASLPRNTPRGLIQGDETTGVPVGTKVAAAGGSLVVADSLFQITAQAQAAETYLTKGGVVSLVVGVFIVSGALFALWDWMGRPRLTFTRDI
jgi:peptidoglycan L-alanyl-D-glutamate endopeptidase CwlK